MLAHRNDEMKKKTASAKTSNQPKFYKENFMKLCFKLIIKNAQFAKKKTHLKNTHHANRYSFKFSTKRYRKK